MAGAPSLPPLSKEEAGGSSGGDPCAGTRKPPPFCSPCCCLPPRGCSGWPGGPRGPPGGLWPRPARCWRHCLPIPTCGRHSKGIHITKTSVTISLVSTVYFILRIQVKMLKLLMDLDSKFIKDIGLITDLHTFSERAT